MSSKEFLKVGDIFNCNLVLENGEQFTIPMRQDGYIHATALCKASEKRLVKWKENKETNQKTNQKKTDYREGHNDT